ncbi:AI-2E family transporter, partial [Hansschlegelia beijingensis]
MTFADIILTHAERRPDAPALSDLAGTVSYRELADRVDDAARWLAALVAVAFFLYLFSGILLPFVAGLALA